MKQVNEMRKPSRAYLCMRKLWLLIVLGMIAGIAPMVAQGIQWAGGTPKLNPELLILEGESGELELYFTARNDIPKASVEIELPANFKYMGLSVGEGMGNGITYSSQSKNEKLTLTITSNGGILAQGDNFHINVKVAAKCGAENGAEISVKVKSDVMTVDRGENNVPVMVQTPTIRITSPEPKQ